MLNRPKPQSAWASRSGARDFLLRNRGWLGPRRSLSVVLSLVAVVVLQQRLSNAADLRDVYGAHQSVYVANQDLTAGHVLTSDDIDVQQWPAGLVPDSVWEQNPEGSMLRHPVSNGSALVMQTAPIGALALTESEVALTIPRFDTSPPVEAGSTVLVVQIRSMSGSSASNGINTEAAARAEVISAAQVVEVSETGITLAVRQDQALQIVEALAQGAIELLVTP